LVPKSQVGTKVGPYEEELVSSRVQAFARSIGADPALGVPPTYVTAFRRGEFDLMQGLGIKLNQVLHGEQDYVYEGSLKVGDRVRYETKLAQILEKKSATALMQILLLETQIQAAGKLVATARTTIIVRAGR